MQFWTLVPILSAFSVYSAVGQFMAPQKCQPVACPHPCPFGYDLDTNGCQTCTCIPGPALPIPGANGLPGSGDIVAQINTSPTFINPCIKNATCGIQQCASGFYNGPGGCQFCVCAPEHSSLTSYTNPCSDAAGTCDAICNNGFQTGIDGCQYCICAMNTPAAAQTPPPPTPTASKEDECLMKITECQLLHPYGFMTDSGCELCIGKDEIYRISEIPPERQPMIKLSNPCIMGFDVCRIFCASGYKNGPRSCQYCACRNDNILRP